MFHILTLPARAAIEWTARVLSEENRSLLRRLTLVRQTGEITLVHATLNQPGNGITF